MADQITDASKEYDFERTLGIITAWDEYAFGNNANVGEDRNPHPKSRTKFTVDDLYVILRKLKHFIDPKNIERIERLIVLHINNKDNPHGVTIEQLVTSVMNELYKDWLIYKNRELHCNDLNIKELRELYPAEQFLKILFQQIKIADQETALENVSTTEVTSVADVYQMIDRHNNDLEAHANLFEYLFPGEVHDYASTFALIAAAGQNEELTIIRNSTLSYMGPDGIYYKANKNTLPIDWSTGKAAYPLFGPTQNLCTHGSLLTAASFVKTNVSVERDPYGMPGITNDRHDYGFRITSTNTDNPVIHKLTYTVPKANLSGKKVLCVSLHARAGSMYDLGINVYQGSKPNEFNCYHYNLPDTATYCISDKIEPHIRANIHNTPSGYSRCSYVCEIDSTKDAKIDIHILDILDGDLNFQTFGNSYLYMTGIQIETDMDTPSTYKATTGNMVAEEGTIVYMNTESIYPWYNRHCGGLLFEVSGISGLNVLNSARYVFDATVNNQFSAFAAYYPTVHNGKLTGYFSNKNGSLVFGQEYSRSDEFYVRYGLGFANSGHKQQLLHSNYADELITDEIRTFYIVGNKDNIIPGAHINSDGDISTEVNKLYIGCHSSGTSFLNGYLTELIYYPTPITPGHIRFFTKG